MYHYTSKRNYKMILKNGISPLYKGEDTININSAIGIINKEVERFRNECIFLFSIDDDYNKKTHTEIEINFEDVDIKNLYVANWECADYINSLSKNKDKEKLLKICIQDYINSIKKVTHEDDLYLYDRTEILYKGVLNK